MKIMIKEVICKICRKIELLSQKASLLEAERKSGCTINFVGQGYGGGQKLVMHVTLRLIKLVI